MRRRIIGLAGLGVATLAIAVAGGCRGPRPSASGVELDGDHAAARRESSAFDDHAPAAVEFDHAGVHAVDDDGKGPAKPFFKNNRKAGGLSSEAREIERSLGVH